MDREAARGCSRTEAGGAAGGADVGAACDDQAHDRHGRGGIQKSAAALDRTGRFALFPCAQVFGEGGSDSGQSCIAAGFEPLQLVALALVGEPWPALPAIPGRQHVTADAPLTADELVGVTSATELALLLGISKSAAWQRLQRAQVAA